jgi:Zn-dependent protease with chaperone function
MKRFIPLAALALSACVGTTGPAPQPWPAASGPLPAPEPAPDPETAARNFGAVVARVEPVAEAECRARLPDENCDFRIVVDTAAGAPANAYQTRDKAGRPIIAFTVALVGEARNQDELAFVMGHEAAHHILDHIPRQKETAMIGGALTGVLAAALGGNPTAIQTAQNMGATVGARTYSKDFELEADELGTVLAWSAGYDPLRGAAFFTRIPDPGNGFLGTHPPNAQRLDTVRRTVGSLR